MGIEPAGSLQALAFAAMFSGAVSMADDMVLRDFGVGKKNFIDNFQRGTETALGRANILRTTKIESLQAFVMYMVSNFSIANHIFILRRLSYQSVCVFPSGTDSEINATFTFQIYQN